MVGVERFDKSKLQTADQPKQSLAKSKDMTLVEIVDPNNCASPLYDITVFVTRYAICNTH